MLRDPSTAIIPSLGDARSRALAERLKHRAREVTEPQRSRITERLAHTLFISHTSADDAFIKGSDEGTRSPKPGSIWWIARNHFYDPFYHSFITGGAEEYERIVGLALLASRRVLAVWSKNALRSDYVRAEILIATEGAKRVAVYVAPRAPQFPIAGVSLIYDVEALDQLLFSWKHA
jgi:hypothetical protein